MSRKNPYKDFVGRYLARGAVGVSVGLAAVAPASAATDPETSKSEQAATKSFADRLSTVRSSVSEHVNEPVDIAQVIPHPPPPVQPFKNFFGKAPFQDTFKNTFANVPAPKK